MAFSTGGFSGGASSRGGGKGGLVGIVKAVDRAPNPNELRIKLKLEDKSQTMIYAPKKFAKELKPERAYNFHLEEATFRGGSRSRASGPEMIRRTREKPEEVKGGSFSGGSSGGGFGGGSPDGGFGKAR